jgi:hypothetical protein
MTEVSVRGRVGPDTLQDGAEAKVRQGRSAEAVVTELHGRFYEQTKRGNVFSDGLGLTAINNATYTTATTGATVTPIAGLYNPLNSGVDCAIIEVSLALVMTALAATGPGGFAYMVATGQSAISTGNTPLNRYALTQGGAKARGLCNVAPTGLTGSFAVRFGSSLMGGSAENVTFTATAVAMQTQALGAKELFDGSVIVPPGGALALVATTTPAAHSAVSAIVWEEVPV